MLIIDVKDVKVEFLSRLATIVVWFLCFTVSIMCCIMLVYIVLTRPLNDGKICTVITCKTTNCYKETSVMAVAFTSDPGIYEVCIERK